MFQLDRYEIKEDPNEPDCFIFTPIDGNLAKYFLKSSDAVNADFSKTAWVKEVAEAKEGLGKKKNVANFNFCREIYCVSKTHFVVSFISHQHFLLTATRS